MAKHTIADYYPAGMSDCDHYGMMGNCGEGCPVNQRGECPHDPGAEPFLSDSEIVKQWTSLKEEATKAVKENRFLSEENIRLEKKFSGAERMICWSGDVFPLRRGTMNKKSELVSELVLTRNRLALACVHIEGLMAMIKKHQWNHDGKGYYCIECGALKEEGCFPSCEISSLLQGEDDL